MGNWYQSGNRIVEWNWILAWIYSVRRVITGRFGENGHGLSRSWSNDWLTEYQKDYATWNCSMVKRVKLSPFRPTFTKVILFQRTSLYLSNKNCYSNFDKDLRVNNFFSEGNSETHERLQRGNGNYYRHRLLKIIAWTR
jgi:hypothetical protein